MAVWSVGTGRYAASEVDVLGLPQWYPRDGTVPGIVYCHGAGETGPSILNGGGNKPLEAAIISKLAERWPLVACDLGTGTGTTSTDSWGNTNAQARVGDAITWLQSASGGGAKTGKVALIAISMGNATAVNYAKNNPTKVSCLARILPVSDLDDIRDNNRGSFRTSISSAWGTAAWTAPGTPPLPAGANPATDHAGAVGIPEHSWYAANDAIVIAQTVIDLSTALGGTATSVGNLGHSDAAVGAVPFDDLASFIQAHA